MNLFPLGALGDNFERPLASNKLAIPESLRLVKESLVFSTTITEYVSPEAPGLLKDFVVLAEGNASSALKYATHFGPLGLCARHALPLFHTAGAVCWPQRVNDGFAESIEGWRRYARRVHSILLIAATLKRGELERGPAWCPLLPLLGITSVDALNDNHEGSPDEVAHVHAQLLAVAINRLLDEARPQPVVSVRPDGPPRLQITFQGGPRWEDQIRTFTSQTSGPTPKGLKGRDLDWLAPAGNLAASIAFETAMAAAGHFGLAQCGDCRRLYRPTRALPLKKLHFCPECGRRASRKLYMRRARAAARARREAIASRVPD
jgi:hypothetical protein